MEKSHTSIETVALLQGLGIEEKPAQIYLAALQIGRGTISELARAAGIERTNLYDHLGSLIETGLIKETRSGKRSLYLPADPANLKNLISARQAKLEALLPNLASQFQQYTNKSSVVYYQGHEGIINLYEDYYRILKNLPKGTHFLVFAQNSEALEVFPELPKYIARRLKLGNHESRGIFPLSEQPRNRVKIDQEDMKNRTRYNIKTTDFKKYLADKYMPTNTILIFGRYVVSIDWKTMFASLTENPGLADTWGRLFDFTWDHLPADKASSAVVK